MKSNYYDGSKGLTIDLIGKDKLWILTRVEVHRGFRGHGYAREMMEVVCADADAEGSILLLSVQPDGTGAPRDALVRFYETLGFKMFYPEEDVMRREPRV